MPTPVRKQLLQMAQAFGFREAAEDRNPRVASARGDFTIWRSAASAILPMQIKQQPSAASASSCFSAWRSAAAAPKQDVFFIDVRRKNAFLGNRFLWHELSWLLPQLPYQQGNAGNNIFISIGLPAPYLPPSRRGSLMQLGWFWRTA